MATPFAYRAADVDGRVVEGHLEARDRDEAVRRIVEQGLTPVRIVRADGGLGAPQAGWHRLRWPGRASSAAPTRAETLALSSELAVMLRAGLALDGALRVLAGMSHRPVVSRLLDQLREVIKGGVPLSRALAAHGEVFGPFYVSMVRAGEASGQLGAALTRVVEHLERVQKLRDAVTSALIYPCILALVALLSVLGMLAFVVPQFETLFADARDALPWSTRLVIELSHLLVDHAVLLAAGAAVAATLLWQGRNAALGLRWRAALSAALPFAAKIGHAYETAQFLRSLATLLSSGVPMLSALSIAGQSLRRPEMREAIGQVGLRVKSGGRLSQAFEATGRFDALSLNLVRVGEETGALDRMVMEAATILAAQVEAAIRRALALLEPALILLLGVFVAAVIVSIVLGILTVNDLVL